MAEKKIIAVVGATGAQGGGLVRAILADPSGPFAARAITRKSTPTRRRRWPPPAPRSWPPTSTTPASMRQAFEGAYGAFCVTNFWEHFSPEKELAQARNMAAGREGRRRAARDLVDPRGHPEVGAALSDDRMPTLMGKYKVPTSTPRARPTRSSRDLGVPTTFLLTSFYWDNFIYFGDGSEARPGREARRSRFPMGDKKLPGIAAEDIGKCAYGIFKRGREFIGKTVGIAGEHLTGAEMAAGLSRALGKEVRYNDVPPEVYRSFGFPGADDLGNMFQFKRDFNDYFVGARDIAFARTLNPELQSFDQWLGGTKTRFRYRRRCRRTGGQAKTVSSLGMRCCCRPPVRLSARPSTAVSPAPSHPCSSVSPSSPPLPPAPGRRSGPTGRR